MWKPWLGKLSPLRGDGQSIVLYGALVYSGKFQSCTLRCRERSPDAPLGKNLVIASKSFSHKFYIFMKKIERDL